MSDKIKPDDLIDIATIQRLEKLYQSILDVKTGIEDSIKPVRDYLSTWQAIDSKSIQQLNTAVAQSSTLQKQLTNVTKEQIKVEQEVEKLKQQQIKTSNMQIAATTKAAKNTNNLSLQLRNLKKELATIDPKKDPERFAAIARQAGELKDKISDANEAIKVFSKDSKAAQAKTLFGQIGSDLASLDFDAAADKARQFSQLMKTITFSEVVGGLKSFGSALVNVGKSLIANPFILLATTVTALGIALYNMNKNVEENKKAFDDATKSVNDYKNSIDKLINKVQDSKDALLVQMGIISPEEAQINQIRRNLKEALDASLEAARERNKKIIEDEKLNEKQKKDLRLQIQEQYNREANALRVEANAKIQAIQLAQLEKVADKVADEAIKQNEKIKKIQEQRLAFLKRSIKVEFEQRISLLDEIRQAEIDQIEDERLRKIQQLKFDFQRDKKRIENLSASEDEKNKLIIEKQKILINKLNKLEKDAIKLKGVLDDEDNKEYLKRLKDKEQAQKEQIERLNKIIEDGLNFAAKKRNDAINRELSEREMAVKRQEELAARGLDNTLDYENKKLAEAELRREQEKRRELRRQKSLTYLKLVSAYAEKGDVNATRKALVDIALSELVAGSFYKGTERVADDLGKPVFSGRDGYLIRADGEERILTGEQNKMIGDLKNEELALIAKSYNNGTLLPNYATDNNIGFSENIYNSILINQLSAVNKNLEEVKNVIRNKKEVSYELSKTGDVIITQVENGIKNVITKKTRKPRI